MVEWDMVEVEMGEVQVGFRVVEVDMGKVEAEKIWVEVEKIVEIIKGNTKPKWKK